MWPDLQEWTRLELSAKSADATAEAISSTASSVRDALRRTYGAVAFDIDGTLTDALTPEVDQRLEETIRALLQRSVHVILITGRGKSSSEVVYQISSSASFSRKYLQRLHCIFDNGASHYRIRVSDDALDLQPETLASLPNLTDLSTLIRSAISELELGSQVQSRVRSERVRIQCTDMKSRDLLMSQMLMMLRTSGVAATSPGIHLAAGRYQELFTIDVTPTTKGRALVQLSERIGLHPDRILRIGDQGQEGGNDFEVLDNPSGFSVGSTSTVIGKCHVVVRRHPISASTSPELGTSCEIAVGADATDALLEMVRLQPSLTISPDAGTDFAQRLVDTEKGAWLLATRARQDSIDKFSSRVAALFYGESGVLHLDQPLAADIYDPLSGAVRLRNWEIQEAAGEIELGSLFQLNLFDFGSRPPGAQWAMYSDSGVLLRGPGYYFRETPSGKHHQDAIKEYLERTQLFLSSALGGIAVFVNREPTIVRLKLLLAVADNIRNFLLQLAHLGYVFETEAGVGPSTVFSTVLTDLLPLHTEQLWEFHRGSEADWTRMLERYFDVLMYIGREVDKIRRSAVDEGIRDAEPDLKVLRRRECDAFLENLTAIELGFAKHAERALRGRDDKVVVVGLSHGGIELPFIARVVGQEAGHDTKAGLMSVSNYGRSAESSLEGFDTYEPMEVLQNLWLERGTGFPDCSVLLADDNIITGRTIEQARDALLDVGARVPGAIVVRYPSVSRLQHMSYADMAKPDPDILLTFTRGLISAGPYTRLVEPYDVTDPDRGRLDDVTGIFDKSRERIGRYLVKNTRTSGKA